MAKKQVSPEEKEALKQRYAAENSAKAKSREDKKAKFDNTNLPVVEMIIPWTTHKSEKKVLDIDLEKPPWDSYPDALEENWRIGKFLRDGESYTGPVKRKIIRS